MPNHLTLLVGTEDAAVNLMNSAVAAQAIAIGRVDVFKARMENMGALGSFPYMADFLFPLPGSTADGYVVEIAVEEDDDLKLLDNALNHYFRVRVQPDFRDFKIQQMARGRGYHVNLIRPDDIYVRARLPSKDAERAVDAFLGYNFMPPRNEFPRLEKAYPGLVDAVHTVVPVGKAGPPQPVGKFPGRDVLMEVIETARKNGRRMEPPMPDNLMFFNHLLQGIYILPDGKDSVITGIDAAALSDFANSEEDVSPAVKRMEYTSTLKKKDGFFQPKTTDEVLKDLVGEFDDLADNIVKDILD